MVGKKLAQEHFPVLADDHFAAEIPKVDLCHRLSAATAGGQNLITRNSDYRIDLGLSVCQHLGDRCHLGTESKPALKVNADSRVDAALHCAKAGLGSERI